MEFIRALKRIACLQRLEKEAAAAPLAEGGESLLALLRGDCHRHSDWSDGGSPIEETGRTAAELSPERARPGADGAVCAAPGQER